MALFGSFYLYFIYAFLNRDECVRIPAIVYSSAIVYSTIVYFLFEVLYESGAEKLHKVPSLGLGDALPRFASANLLVVIIVNIPYTIVPLWLLWKCVFQQKIFGGEDNVHSRSWEKRS